MIIGKSNRYVPANKGYLSPVMSEHESQVIKLANQIYQDKEQFGFQPSKLDEQSYLHVGKGMYYFMQDEEPEVSCENAVSPDVEQIRRDFPILKRKVNSKPLVWLDNAATTQKPMCVIDALKKYYSEYNSNVHRGAHTLAKQATNGYEDARQKTAQFIGADKAQVVFVRGATEAINLVANTWGVQNLGKGDEIIISQMEHHSNIVPWQMLAEKTGCTVKAVSFDENGQINMDEYAGLFTQATKLAAITHVSNVLGTINPISQMAQIAHMNGARILVDGAQGAPHLPVDVKQLDADFYVFSGHKVYGPTGIGVLYAKKELLESMPVYQSGGGMIRNVAVEHSEFQNAPEKFEAGTVNIADAIGLGAAIDYLSKIGMEKIHSHETQLTDYLMSELERIPGVWVIGTAPNKTSVVSFVMDTATPDTIAKSLDRQGIAVRSGHHCAQPLLNRLGLTSTARASLGLYNTYEEIDTFVQNIRKISMS